MTIKKALSFYITLLFISMVSVALSQSLTSSVSKNTVSLNDRFTLTFKLEGQASNIKIPDFSKDFRVISGPNRSSSMQWVNGKMSSSLSYSYVLVPLSEGAFTIGSASTTVNGQKLTSDPITITVKKGAAGSNSNNGTNTKVDVPENNNNVFIKLFINKSKVYQGEEITATYKIYTRADIVDYEFKQIPSFNGFWSSEVDLGNVSLKPENLNGVNYYSATLKKVILSPQRSGNITIDPMKMDIVLRLKQKGNPYSIFDDFFGSYKDIKYSINSNQATVQVLPFPKNGKPENFSGASGKFTITSNVTRNKVKTNDALNFKVRVKGTGNLNLISEPVVDFPPDFEVYDPKVNENINNKGSQSSGYKEWEYIIIPRVAGTFEIPAVHFSYFNLDNKTYHSKSTDPIQIEVESDGSSNAVSTYQSNPSKKEIKTLASDIRFIKTKYEPTLNLKQLFFGSFLHHFLLLLPLIVLIALIVFFKRQLKLKSDTITYKKKTANKVATKQLAKAKTLLEAGNKQTFFEEVFNALYGYMENKFAISKSELSKETIIEKLKAHQFTESVVNDFISTIEQCEMARFAPSSNENMQEVYNKSIQIISTLENKK